MKRISSGYYIEDYKGQEISIIRTFIEWEKKYFWYCLINEDGGNDYHNTKKECLFAAKYMIDHHNEYCLKLK